MDVEEFVEGMKSYLQQKEKEKIVNEKKEKSKGWGWFSKPKELTQEEMN